MSTHTLTHRQTHAQRLSLFLFCLNASGPENCDSPLSGPDIPPPRVCPDGTVLVARGHGPPRLPITAVSLMFDGYLFFVSKKLFCEPFLFVVWEKTSLLITRTDRERQSCPFNGLHCRKSHLPPRWTLQVTPVRASALWLKSSTAVWR